MSHPPPSHEPMSPLDELLFRSERDPVKRPTMAAVYLLDATPDWGHLEHTFERASRELAWRGVELAHPDAAMLDLLAFVLGCGESSRLAQRGRSAGRPCSARCRKRAA